MTKYHLVGSIQMEPHASLSALTQAVQGGYISLGEAQHLANLRTAAPDIRKQVVTAAEPVMVDPEAAQTAAAPTAVTPAPVEQVSLATPAAVTASPKTNYSY